MTAITVFKDLLAKGHKGEALVANLFQALGYEVQNVANDQVYFSKDIDLIATKGDEQLLLEVKADSRVAATNNVVIETIGNIAAAKRVGYIILRLLISVSLIWLISLPMQSARLNYQSCCGGGIAEKLSDPSQRTGNTIKRLNQLWCIQMN